MATLTLGLLVAVARLALLTVATSASEASDSETSMVNFGLGRSKALISSGCTEEALDWERVTRRLGVGDTSREGAALEETEMAGERTGDTQTDDSALAMREAERLRVTGPTAATGEYERALLAAPPLERRLATSSALTPPAAVRSTTFRSTDRERVCLATVGSESMPMMPKVGEPPRLLSRLEVGSSQYERKDDIEFIL